MPASQWSTAPGSGPGVTIGASITNKIIIAHRRAREVETKLRHDIIQAQDEQALLVHQLLMTGLTKTRVIELMRLDGGRNKTELIFKRGAVLAEWGAVGEDA